MNKKFLNLISNPLKFKLFLFKNLPAALFSGVKLKSISDTNCEVTIAYKWFNRNPFKSTYFACLSMAAEMSTGVLALGNIFGKKPSISMLVVNLTGEFYKKATDVTIFTCNDGLLFQQKIEEAIKTQQAQIVTAQSNGYNTAGELVAKFTFTWSFKQKSS